MALLAETAPPCISIYQPTHRHHPDNQQDPIRYRNLLKQVEASLERAYPTRDIAVTMAALHALSHDSVFWQHRSESLAVLAHGERVEWFDILRPVKELVVVADTFHIKPLLRVLQSADQFHILCINRQEAWLYQGSRDAIEPIAMPMVPTTIEAALGTELSEPHHGLVSHGKASGHATHHGQGSRKEELEIDAERFFRAIDRAVAEHHSRPTGLPLLLVALPEHRAVFRAVSHNPALLADGLDINPSALECDDLRQRAWKVIEPSYLARLAALTDTFQHARARGEGADDLADVAAAAVAGRVAALLVEADREIPGRVDPQTGRIALGELADPTVDDLLDDIAEHVIRRKGTVVVVPAARMPTTTGVAATYRY
jgi:hypothetical protein